MMVGPQITLQGRFYCHCIMPPAIFGYYPEDHEDLYSVHHLLDY